MKKPLGFAANADHDPDGRLAPDRDRLRLISSLLGCDVETFLSGAPLPDDREALADTSELIHLWLAIPSACGRAKLLAMVRELAPA